MAAYLPDFTRDSGELRWEALPAMPPSSLPFPDATPILLLAGVALVALNLLTFAVFAHDKRAARRRGARRIPERTLHTLELLGGWPGSLAAQRLLRHKTAKASYLRVFWAIGVLHGTLGLLVAWACWR